MDTTYRLISVDQLALIQKYLERSIRYCNEARPFVFDVDNVDTDPTEFYSGASGYARGTMSMVLSMLSDLPQQTTWQF